MNNLRKLQAQQKELEDQLRLLVGFLRQPLIAQKNIVLADIGETERRIEEVKEKIERLK